MPFEFLDIAPALPASVALVYVLSFTHAWDRVLPLWTLDRPGDLEMRRKSHSTDEEAIGHKLAPLSRPKKMLDISSVILQIVHQYFTAGRLFGKGEAASTHVCLVQLGLVASELAIYYARTGVWKQRQLILLGSVWACMIARSPWSTQHSKFDAISSLVIAMTGIGAILPQDQPLAPSSASVDEAISKSNSIDPVSEPDKQPPYLLVHLHIFSVALLLILLLDEHRVLESSSRLGAYRYLYIPALLLVLRYAAENWLGTSRSDQNFRHHVQAYIHQAYTSAPQYLRSGILRPLSVLLPFFTLFLLTSSLSSCLGFRKLILGLPRTTPTFRSGGILGASVYPVVACVHLVLRRQEIGQGESMRMRRLNMTLLAAFGQTMTGLVAFAILLSGIPILRSLPPINGCLPSIF